jgi:hypothetical protein
MVPFNGYKIIPRVTARAGDKMFSWLFDIGASATCMTSTSFHTAFPDKKTRMVQNAVTIQIHHWRCTGKDFPLGQQHVHGVPPEDYQHKPRLS